jgi:hypothetical protein
MMRKTRWSLVVRACALVGAALLLFADAGAAQGGQGRGRAPGGPGPALLRDSLPAGGPIELLLARRDSLQLTAAQVRELDRLGAELQRQNAPHVERMLELRRELQPLVGMHPRDMSEAQRAQFQRRAAHARPLMERVQENNRRAMERVSEVLTPEQKQRVRTWLQGEGMLGRGRGGP